MEGLNNFFRALYRWAELRAHHLNRKQWALLFSSVILGVFIILSYQLKLKSLANEILIELNIEDPIEEVKEKEVTEEKKEEDIQQSEPKTNKAYNSSLKQTYTTPPPIKSIDNALEKIEKDNKDGEPEGIASDFELKLRALQANDIQDRIDSIGIPDEVNNFKKDTRIWYSLVNRTHRKIAVPIYICDMGGKVAVNILVSASGNVLETNINQSASTTNNGCLLETAQEYAQKTTFMPGKGTNQWGVIYYLFSKR